MDDPCVSCELPKCDEKNQLCVFVKYGFLDGTKRARAKRYRIKHPNAQTDYCKKNTEIIKAINRRYYLKNRVNILAKKKVYYQQKP